MSDLSSLLVKELKALVGFNTVSSESDIEIGEYLAKKYKTIGFDVELIKETDSNKKIKTSVMAKTGPDFETLVFAGHKDTVPPGELNNWTECNSNPFMLTVKDGKTYGLGTSDMKASIACMNILAEKITKFRLKRGFCCIFSHDEETGLLGIRNIFKNKKVPQAKYALIGEPTNNRICTTEKGYAAINILINIENTSRLKIKTPVTTVTITGKEAHSGRPNQGINAIVKALQFLELGFNNYLDTKILSINGGTARNVVAGMCSVILLTDSAKIRELAKNTEGISVEISQTDGEFLDLTPSVKKIIDIVKKLQLTEEKIKRIINKSFLPEHTTLNIGCLGEKKQKLIIAMDFRTIPEQSNKEIFELIKNEVLKVSPSTIELAGEFIEAVPESLDISIKDKFGYLFTELGKSAYTEAAEYQKHGVQVMIAGPGNTLVHKPNEYVEISAMLKGIELYEEIIRFICTK